MGTEERLHKSVKDYLQAEVRNYRRVYSEFSTPYLLWPKPPADISTNRGKLFDGIYLQFGRHGEAKWGQVIGCYDSGGRKGSASIVRNKIILYSSRYNQRGKTNESKYHQKEQLRELQLAFGLQWKVTGYLIQVISEKQLNVTADINAKHTAFIKVYSFYSLIKSISWNGRHTKCA
jgi:hypothetical protein